jgi:cytochrome subunit of sulfide dehydrogenase
MAMKLMKLALIASAVTLGLATTAFAAKEEAKPAPATAPAPAAAPATAPVELISGASAQMLGETCNGCHGTDGASAGPASPNIGGLHPEYFASIMKSFKDGTAYSTVMGRISKGYSEEEVKLMADYFAAKRYVPAKQKFDEKLAATGKKIHDKWCEKCHAEGGKVVPDEEYQVIAGQWTPYLKYAMADFQAGTREMPKKMKEKFDGMIKKEGDKGLDALYAFYASQK